MIKGASCKYTNQLSKKEIANTELIASDISHPDCEMMTIKIAKFCNRRPQKSDQKYLSRAENLLTANIRLNPVNLNPEIIRLLIVTLIN